MLGNKLICGLTAVLMLSACASTVFPDFDDNEDDIEVREGGRVVRELPDEGNSLKADTENAAYEGEKTAEEDEVEAVKTEPVAKEELSEENEDVTVAAEEVNAEPAGPSVSYRVETIYFDNGSSAVDAKYNAALRKVAKMVKENNASVVVYGHASSRTRDTDPVSHKMANFKASAERAQSVAAALKRAGVPASKITVEALSDSQPAYLEVMPEGERLNRRAEIYISY